MIRLHGNVRGTPTGAPILTVDPTTPDAVPQVVTGDLSVPGRVTFTLAAGTLPHGATVAWADQVVRIVLAVHEGEPLASGDYEGSALVVPLPPLGYRPRVAHLRIDGDQFWNGPRRFRWRGATDFRLAQRLFAGDDLSAILAQRQAAGITIVRVLAMKANNTGWSLDPARVHDYWGGIQRFFDQLGDRGLACEWTVFADTRSMMSSRAQQIAFWVDTCEIVRAYPFVVLELVNEAGHHTQVLDPRDFPRPTQVLASHGSGLTDDSPVLPLWDFATYHARRDGPPDTRGFTNYDPFEFQANWPKPCPFICDEGIKPAQYGYDTGWARQMGRHAAMGAGGTFHTDHGVNSDLWPTEVDACARAFCAAIED